MTESKSIIFIVGPTAIGKSDVAYLLAKKLNGEIVSCDSMQVYKEMDIASNKPSKEVQKNIPHHLINVVSLSERFDVALFNKLANEAIKNILAKNKVPIIVGGSGLYMQILLDGIFTDSKGSQELRKQIEQEVQEKGLDALYAELKDKDPKASEKIHAHDRKKIVRAIEICRSTGRTKTQVGQKREGLWGKYNIKIFGLNAERSWLYERINLRADKMFEEGLIDEVKALNQDNLSLTAQGLIGIKEVLGYLNKEHDLDRAKYLLQLNTRHLAKRQLTWFRAEKRIKWLEIKPENSMEIIADDILHLIEKE